MVFAVMVPKSLQGFVCRRSPVVSMCTQHGTKGVSVTYSVVMCEIGGNVLVLTLASACAPAVSGVCWKRGRWGM
jgi:hypothetical protein